MRSTNKMTGEKQANIGLYFMLFKVNIKCVQWWLWAFAESRTELIVAVVQRYSGGLKAEKSKHAGRAKHIAAALSEGEVKYCYGLNDKGDRATE